MNHGIQVNPSLTLHDAAAIFTFICGEALENVIKSEMESFFFNTFIPAHLVGGEEVEVRVEILNRCLYRIQFDTLPEFNPSQH